jgi:sortase (surface protein transpeptidase)
MSKRKYVINNFRKIYIFLGFFFLTISFILILVPIAPYILYRLNPELTNTEIDNIEREITEEPIVPKDVDTNEDNNTIQLPPKDSSLPTDPYLLIPSITVSSPIGSTEDPELSLTDGTWLAPDYGNPEDPSLPIIMAAHRFGYTYWDRETRNRVSFFNLPKTEIGDSVEIIWGQRKYMYKIYAEDESTYIKDYEADLILYTCKYFNSPQRIFRYATRVN